MNLFHGLQLAIDLAERQRDACAQALAHALRQVQQGQQQMQQLQSYAQDTDARWTRGSSAALSAELVRHHYQFMERLQHAIGMQDGVMANLARQELQSRDALAQAEMRVAGLKQVLKKRMQQRATSEQRREQARMDEMAALMHARNRVHPRMEDAR